MSGGPVCRCSYGRGRLRVRHWRVVERNCNHSAFNGGHWTWSDYSQLRCQQCGRMWRTKAAYVRNLSDMTTAERAAWIGGAE